MCVCVCVCMPASVPVCANLCVCVRMPAGNVGSLSQRERGSESCVLRKERALGVTCKYG